MSIETIPLRIQTKATTIVREDWHNPEPYQCITAISIGEAQYDLPHPAKPSTQPQETQLGVSMQLAARLEKYIHSNYLVPPEQRPTDNCHGFTCALGGVALQWWDAMRYINETFHTDGKKLDDPAQLEEDDMVVVGHPDQSFTGPRTNGELLVDYTDKGHGPLETCHSAVALKVGRRACLLIQRMGYDAPLGITTPTEMLRSYRISQPQLPASHWRDEQQPTADDIHLYTLVQT